MGLRNAFNEPTLLALKGDWVKLTVTDRKYTVERLSQAQADAWWEENGPDPVDLPDPNTEPKQLLNTDQIIPDDDSRSLYEKIHDATLAYGAKVANYAVLSAYQRLSSGTWYNTVDGREVIPTRKAFGIPVCYYVDFMRQNGLFDLFDRMRADSSFQSDPFVRDKLLARLREAILAAPVSEDLQELLSAKLADSGFRGKTLRFRSSTNAEDLDGFPCAGCYDSHTGDPEFWDDDLLLAIRQSWSTVWKFRTYEEREFHRIDHKKVAMALLVHENFPDEYANGVAVTNNPYNPAGNDPAFYINVQRGGAAEVVAPPVGVTTDMFLYYFYQPSDQGGIILNFSSHSNLLPDGGHVLSNTQTRILGEALNKINALFLPAYAGTSAWWAMDVEFKFNDEGTGTPVLWIKQARPYHGRGL
ncbi:MAG: hypothetical protein JW940_32170 [Polyangiaceae bacterium]|nr:hypothetical protein [Polyangiaceae bacterium]